MDIPEDPVRHYLRLAQDLLARRVLDRLSVDDEGELAERLDDVWRELSAEQQQEVEDWLAT
jgi:hypothetical protein